MEHYVTLFDSKYLPQGISLYRSMERWCGEFTLWVICMDDLAEELLTELNYNSMNLIPLSDVENEELLQVKPDRTVGEYCWTLTPFAADAVFDKDSSVGRVTYLDADLWFRSSPAKIFMEFEASNSSVLITEHGYSPENDQSARSGFYCVQFLTLSRHGSLAIRSKWQTQCIEWCFNRFEDGKFGDQKYLDTWPFEYGSEVHVMGHLEWALAPWNATRFPYSSAIFYHFHGVRIKSREQVRLGLYVLPEPLIDFVYRVYLQDLKHAILQLDPHTRDRHPIWLDQAHESNIRDRIRYWRRRVRFALTKTHLRIV
jgi:hypothetical protein